MQPQLYCLSGIHSHHIKILSNSSDEITKTCYLCTSLSLKTKIIRLLQILSNSFLATKFQILSIAAIHLPRFLDRESNLTFPVHQFCSNQVPVDKMLPKTQPFLVMQKSQGYSYIQVNKQLSQLRTQIHKHTGSI